MTAGATRKAPTTRKAPKRAAGESRHRAREAAIQMLYQWEIGRREIADVEGTFWMQIEGSLPEDLRAFAGSLARGVAANVEQLDPMIATAAEHWRIERMA